jgi:hypothetical protein
VYVCMFVCVCTCACLRFVFVTYAWGVNLDFVLHTVDRYS